jgi:hypothetical protein
MHSVCDACLKKYIENTSIKSVGCPCGDGFLDPRTFPLKCFDIWTKKINNSVDTGKQCPTQIFEDHVFPDKCPKCDIIFFDYDACAAIQCICGTWFCALCLNTQKDSGEAHQHVFDCSMNPKTDLYVSLDNWQNIRDIERKKRISVFFDDLALSEGFLYYICIWSKLHFKYSSYILYKYLVTYWYTIIRCWITNLVKQA